MKSTVLQFLVAAAWLLLLPSASRANLSGSDDFNDNTKDPAKWDVDSGYGTPPGVLTETNGRLEFTSSGTTDVYQGRPWKLNFGSFTSDWEVQLDTVIPANSGPAGGLSFGVEIWSTSSPNLYVGVDLDNFGQAPEYFAYRGDAPNVLQETVAIPSAVRIGAVRITFDSTAKVLTTYYDADGPANGYQWTFLASYGIAGSGGDTGNTDWGMTGTDTFTAVPFGFSSGVAASAGQVYGDNFVAIPAPPPAETVVDTVRGVTGEPLGTMFLSFGVPAIDGGQAGGLATITGAAQPQSVIYGLDGTVQARTGRPDPAGAQFLALGDPVFGGEAFGFAGTARQTPSSSPLLRLDARLGFGGEERVFVVKPGGRLVALYSQLTKAALLKRLAAQAGLAPGGGQFATFPSFGLPRARGGLIFTGTLHHGGEVKATNDFGVWREKVGGGESELLLRNGTPLLLADTTTRSINRLALFSTEANSTDQRRSFAPDGGVMAAATFGDGKRGLVRVAADGSADVPVDTMTATGLAGMEFSAFSPPATAGGGRFSFLAKLKAITPSTGAPVGGQPRSNVGLPPTEGIFSSIGGSLLNRGDSLPGQYAATIAHPGTPALGQSGMIGTLAKLVGPHVKPVNNQAIMLLEGGAKAVVARLGDHPPGCDLGVVYQRFLSMVVTDSDPGRLLFTATVAGPGVKASNKMGLWSFSTATGVNLVLRLGGAVTIADQTLTVRSFAALVASPKSAGQGRSTDASGFVTAKGKLSDGRSGVLRIPLP